MSLFGLVLAITLSESIISNFDARIEKVVNIESSLSRFESYPENGALDGFKLNPAFWGKGIDFSCASPWNSLGGKCRAGTLISKRHIIFAKHFPFYKGVRIIFVGEDGGACPVSIDGVRALENCDIMVGLLNAEVTPNIHPAKILPTDFQKYINPRAGFPIAVFDQHERLYVGNLNEIPVDGFPTDRLSARIPENGKRAKFKWIPVTGDSGSPVFLVINNQAILLYCVQSSRLMPGPSIHYHRAEIQSAMDELCPGYKLETYNFSKPDSVISRP